jgi:hypothetical protein
VMYAYNWEVYTFSLFLQNLKQPGISGGQEFSSVLEIENRKNNFFQPSSHVIGKSCLICMNPTQLAS